MLHYFTWRNVTQNTALFLQVLVYLALCLTAVLCTDYAYGTYGYVPKPKSARRSLLAQEKR